MMKIYPHFKAGRNDDFRPPIRTKKSAAPAFFSVSVDREPLPPHRRRFKK
jgi:hypothetical protein